MPEMHEIRGYRASRGVRAYEVVDQLEAWNEPVDNSTLSRVERRIYEWPEWKIALVKAAVLRIASDKLGGRGNE